MTDPKVPAPVAAAMAGLKDVRGGDLTQAEFDAIRASIPQPTKLIVDVTERPPRLVRIGNDLGQLVMQCEPEQINELIILLARGREECLRLKKIDAL